MLTIPPSVSSLCNLVYVPHDTVNDLFGCLCHYIAVLANRSIVFTSIGSHEYCLTIIVLQMTKIMSLRIFMKVNIMSKRSSSLECRPTTKNINASFAQWVSINL